MCIHSIDSPLLTRISTAGIFRLPEEAFNDPERYYCQSQALVDVTNRRKVLHLGNRRTEGSSEEIEEQVVSSSKYALHLQFTT